MRTAVGTVLLALVVGLVAGCGKAHRTGIASANGGHGPGASPSASVDPEEQARQYAKCMREHGVDMPDPDGGRVTIRASGGPGDTEKLDKAQEACKAYAPSGPLRTPDAEELEQMRQWATCMREHGVDIPDPDPGGGGGVRIQAKPDDPTFKAAEEACKDKLPGALRGGGPGGAGGQDPGGRTTGDGP